MAREIKFRAWDFNDKQMQQVTALYFELYRLREIETLEHKGVYIRNFANPQEIIAMQYTGLTDKNGVEIYEGDYVKSTSSFPAFCQFGHDKDCEGVVDFLECGFVITDRKTFARPLFTEICDIEIIGNIYENPELLEGE